MLLLSVILFLVIGFCSADDPTASCFGDEETQKITMLHNQYRRSVGSSDMYQVTWNKDMAKLAQNWAYRLANTNNHTKFSNFTTLDGNVLGQNEFVFYEMVFTKRTWCDAIYHWNKTEVMARQMLLSNVTQIGCGVARHRTCRVYVRVVYVCNYNVNLPTSNTAPAYRTGDACSACGKISSMKEGTGAKCTDGLCDLCPLGSSPDCVRPAA